MTTLHNVVDRRYHWIGRWLVEKLDYATLAPADIGRTVIYCAADGRREAGTLSSYRDGLVFARFSKGDTAAACNPTDLVFAQKPLDGDLGR